MSSTFWQLLGRDSHRGEASAEPPDVSRSLTRRSLRCPQQDFWDLYRRHRAEIPEALCRSFAISLSRTAINRGLQGSNSLKGLVAMAFASLAENCPGQVVGSRCSLGVPIKLADYQPATFGVTRQSVHTAVSQLKERGIIEKQAGVWMIHDRERLLQECGALNIVRWIRPPQPTQRSSRRTYCCPQCMSRSTTPPCADARG